MSSANLPGKAMSFVPPCDEDLTFSALTSRPRRKMLVALATGGPRTGAGLVGFGHGASQWGTEDKFLDSTLKHLKVMLKAGMVVQLDNPQDGRRPLYALTPRAKVTPGADETLIDFGFCFVRLSADGNYRGVAL